MDTHKVPPDADILEQERDEHRRRTVRRRTGAYGLLAALVVAVAVVAVRAGVNPAQRVPLGQPPRSPTAPGDAAPVGTVTFDGSTCSMEITADRIELGFVLFEVVNASEQAAMFDSWRLLEGYTVRAFEATIERDRRLAEKPGDQGAFPSEREVSYLGSEIIPANSSDIIVPQMSTPGTHAIVCLQPFEGDFRPFGIAGPIVVQQGESKPRG
jgi:hypothetical protein